MLGDQNDIRSKLFNIFPQEWIDENLPSTPSSKMYAIFDAVAALLSQNYLQITNGQLSERLITCLSGAIELWLSSFYSLGGSNQPNPFIANIRLTSDTDESYKARALIMNSALKGTRQAVIDILQSFLGAAPTIVVPDWAPDCGGYNLNRVGYGVAGSWGSTSEPYNVLISAPNPLITLYPDIPGWDTSVGAYDVGSTEWVPNSAAITETDYLYQFIDEYLTVAGIQSWMRFTSYQPPTPPPVLTYDYYGYDTSYIGYDVAEAFWT